jgi:hypothetical protein
MLNVAILPPFWQTRVFVAQRKNNDFFDIFVFSV